MAIQFGFGVGVSGPIGLWMSSLLWKHFNYVKLLKLVTWTTNCIVCVRHFLYIYSEDLKAKLIPEVGVHLHRLVVQILLVLEAHRNVAVVEQRWQIRAATPRLDVQIDSVIKGLVAEVLVHRTARHILLHGELLGDQAVDLVLDVVLVEKRQHIEVGGHGGGGGNGRWWRRWWSHVGVALGEHWRHQAVGSASAAVGVEWFVGGIDRVGGEHLLELVPVLVEVGLGRGDDFARQPWLEWLELIRAKGFVEKTVFHLTIYNNLQFTEQKALAH